MTAELTERRQTADEIIYRKVVNVTHSIDSKLCLANVIRILSLADKHFFQIQK